MTVDYDNYETLLQSIVGVYENPALVEEIVKNILAQLRNEKDKAQRADEKRNALNILYQEKNERLGQAENEILTLRSDKTRLCATINQLQEELAHVRRASQQILQNSRNTAAAAEKYQKRYVLEAEEVQRHIETIRQLQEANDEKTKDADEQNKEKMKAQNELQNVQEERNELMSRFSDCQSSNNRLLQAIKEKKKTNTNLQQQLYAAQKELAACQVANNNLKKNSEKSCEEEQNKWIQTITSLEDEVQILKTKLKAKKEKHKMILSQREHDQNAFIQTLLEKSPKSLYDDPAQTYTCIDENNYVGMWTHVGNTFPKHPRNDKHTYLKVKRRSESFRERRSENITSRRSRRLPALPPEESACYASVPEDEKSWDELSDSETEQDSSGSSSEDLDSAQHHSSRPEVSPSRADILMNRGADRNQPTNEQRFSCDPLRYSHQVETTSLEGSHCSSTFPGQAKKKSKTKKNLKKLFWKKNTPQLN